MEVAPASPPSSVLELEERATQWLQEEDALRLEVDPVVEGEPWSLADLILPEEKVSYRNEEIKELKEISLALRRIQRKNCKSC